MLPNKQSPQTGNTPTKEISDRINNPQFHNKLIFFFNNTNEIN